MSEPYGLSPGTNINYKQLGFPAWVDELCRQWHLDSSTYAGHQEGDRPDIGAAPNPDHLNRGIDWTGPPDNMLNFAHWLCDTGPLRSPGVYGPPGLEMVIYQDPRTGEQVWYPPWVDFSSDLPNHTDHVHTRQSAALIDAAPQVMTVPLVEASDGTWTSTSPAWAHLIQRESGGNPTIIQQIIDINSGGNEAEGLFQITPTTWRAHGGEEFAPTARSATPQQQAIVAARIFTANPSGSDWGAGLPGRENPAELAAGLVPLIETPAPVPEEDWMADSELARMIRELHAVWCTDTIPSKSRYGDPNIKWLRRDMLQNDDGFLYDLIIEHDAALGNQEARKRVDDAANRGDQIAQNFLASLKGVPPQSPPPTSPPPPASPPPASPPPPPTPLVKPVLYTVNGFQGDMWQQQPADTARAVEDKYYFQPVGYNSGAFPLGVGRDDGVRELKRLINEHQAQNPGRHFALAGYSLGAVVVDDVFDALRSGDMQQYWPYFLGGVKWGDPRREARIWSGGSNDPGGAGIAGPNNLKQTPANFRSYMYDQNKGDIYANCPPGETGEWMTLVYNLVMNQWDGTIQSVLSQAQEVFAKAGVEALAIIDAVVRGIGFFADQQSHMAYPIDDAVAFLRSLA